MKSFYYLEACFLLRSKKLQCQMVGTLLMRSNLTASHYTVLVPRHQMSMKSYRYLTQYSVNALLKGCGTKTVEDFQYTGPQEIDSCLPRKVVVK